MSLLSPFPSEPRVHGMTPLTFRVGLSSSTSLDTASQLWLGICLLRNSRPCQVDSINRTSCVCLSVCLSLYMCASTHGAQQKLSDHWSWSYRQL